MNFEPQKLFIGLMDFFSILLPGALLTWLLMDEIGPIVLGDRYSRLAGSQAWAAFLFASYLFGHLVFLLGSWLDELYDLIRRHTLNKQIALMARRRHLLNWPVRALIWLVFKREQDVTLNRVLSIKAQALAPLQANSTVNAFQWCKALLNIQSQQSLAVVQRFEADSKFFRCLTVVLLLVLIAWRWQHQWPVEGIPIVVLLLLLALWRYMEQRFKASNQAYWSVITLTANDNKFAADKLAPVALNPTHAGGVVFRKRWFGKPRYLLVEAKDDPAQWVLPKGHVEEGEQPLEAAVREVLEETGVWARPVQDLNTVSFSVRGNIITARFYLMQAIGSGLRKEKDRRHKWLPFKQAVARASHNETRELLQEALAIRSLLETAEQRRSRAPDISIPPNRMSPT